MQPHLSVYLQSVWINSLTKSTFLASFYRHAPFLQSLKSEVTLKTLAPVINWSQVRRCELDIHRSIHTVRGKAIVVCWLWLTWNSVFFLVQIHLLDIAENNFDRTCMRT